MESEPWMMTWLEKDVVLALSSSSFSCWCCFCLVGGLCMAGISSGISSEISDGDLESILSCLDKRTMCSLCCRRLDAESLRKN